MATYTGGFQFDSNGALVTSSSGGGGNTTISNVSINNQLLNITVAPFQVAANATSTASSATIDTSAKFVIISSTVDAWYQLGGTPTAAVNASQVFVGAGTSSWPITMNNLANGSVKVAGIAHNATNAIGWGTVTIGQ